MPPSDDVEGFRSALATSKKIIIVSGAGLSSASGIPTFRGPGGFWRTYDATKLSTPQGFAENQSRLWQFFHYRRELVLKTKPNAAHYTLARLAIPSIRQKLAPGSILTHITQNIDGLSPLSLDEVCKAHLGCEETLEDGTNLGNIIEMHGHLFDVVCTAHDCDYRETNRNSPICPALAGTEAVLEPGAPEPVVRRADLPRCPRPDCGQLCRPGVVWFGERPYRIHEVLALADEADMCIVVGTSAIVQPASRLAGRVKDHGGKVAVFNLEAANHSDEADFLFLGPCEERLAEVFGV